MGEHPETSVPALRRLARGLLFDAHGAEDVVQEAWLAALGVKPPVPRLGAWLSETVKRLALNRRRAELRRRAREESVARAEAQPGADERAEQLEILHRLIDALARLDEPYRSAVMLRYLDDLPPRAIARRLGAPVNTVRTHVRRGLERLRRDLDGERGRDRQGFLAALAPFAGEAPSSVFPWGATTRGSWLLLAAGLLVVLGAWATLRAALVTNELTRSSEPAVAAAREPSPATDAAQPIQPRHEREPATGNSAAMTASWVVTGHAFRGEDEPFPHLPLIGRVYAGSKAEGTPLVEQRCSTDDVGDFAWAIAPPTDLVFVSVEPEIEGHLTDACGGVFLPGDPPPERWTVNASPIDAWVVGTLLDPNGGPIVGALVTSLQRQQTSSDRDGRFRLQATLRDEFSLGFEIFVSAVGFASTRMPIPLRAGEFQIPDTVLKPELRVRGLVLDEGSTPVADAEIGSWSDGHVVTRSREDGSFELGGFDEKDESLTLEVTKDGFAQARQEVARDARSSEIEIRLERGVRVTGRVIAERDGSPVWGAWVSLGFSPVDAEVSGSVLSDREGRYELANVPAGKARFWIHRTGHAITLVQRDIPKNVESVEIDLVLADEDHFIGGVLLSEQGRPAPWKQIRVSDTTRLFVDYAGTHSGSDGRFRVEGLPDRGMNIRAFIGGLVRINENVAGLDRDDLILQLKPTSCLVGRVLDAATDAPVSSFSVRAESPPPSFEDRDVTRVHYYPPRGTFSNPDGTWTIKTAEPPGAAFSLDIEAEGYAIGKAELVRTASDELVIRLARSTLLRGRVIAKESGTPIEGARLLRLTAGQQLQNVENSGEPCLEARSDVAGRFQLTNAPTGEMLLALEVPGRASVLDGPFVVGAAPTERTIEVGFGATIRGRVLDPGGNTLAAEIVTLVAYDGYQQDKEWKATTDTEGHFLFPALAPGSYELTWDSYRDAKWVLALEQQLHVAAEENIETVLRPSGRATMHGTIEFEGELPEFYAVSIEPVVPETMDPALASWARTSWSVPTQGRRFELEHLEPGEYEVSYECVLSDPDAEEMFDQGVVSAYGEIRVTVPAEGSVEVHLTLERHED